MLTKDCSVICLLPKTISVLRVLCTDLKKNSYYLPHYELGFFTLTVILSVTISHMNFNLLLYFSFSFHSPFVTFFEFYLQ